MDQSKTLIPPDLLEKCSVVVEIHKKIANMNQKIQKLNAEYQKILQTQTRLRDNLKSMEKIPNSSKLVERYLSDLNLQEDELIKIRKSIDEAETSKSNDEIDLQSKRSGCSAVASKLLEELNS